MLKNEATSVLFISDLHLEAEHLDITRVFPSLLDERACRAEALYILGDFFEAWIGDDGTDAFQRSIAQFLRQVADGGTRIYLMHGNRDFLIDKAFCREAGCTLLSDPSVIDLYGEPVLLMHGDSLCTRDETYMHPCRWLRNPLTFRVLCHLLLAIRYELARKLRKESCVQICMKTVDIIDVTPEEVPRVMRRYDVHILIHGHTHRPAEHPLDIDGQPVRRIVLGDWDRQGWVLEADANGHRQAPFPL